MVRIAEGDGDENQSSGADDLHADVREGGRIRHVFEDIAAEHRFGCQRLQPRKFGRVQNICPNINSFALPIVEMKHADATVFEWPKDATFGPGLLLLPEGLGAASDVQHGRQGFSALEAKEVLQPFRLSPKHRRFLLLERRQCGKHHARATL